VEIRGESFDLSNRTAFTGLSGAISLSNANFGLSRSQSGSGRRMQSTAKFYW
jgi:hypothetical protein